MEGRGRDLECVCASASPNHWVTLLHIGHRLSASRDGGPPVKALIEEIIQLVTLWMPPIMWLFMNLVW